MGKDTDLKFSVWIELNTRKPWNAKVGQQGRVLCYVTYFFKFWDTLHISGMGTARDFKLGDRIDRQACKPKMQK